jgi:hypothetical protein
MWRRASLRYTVGATVLPIEIELSNPEIPPLSRIASRNSARGDANYRSHTLDVSSICALWPWDLWNRGPLSQFNNEEFSACTGSEALHIHWAVRPWQHRKLPTQSRS